MESAGCTFNDDRLQLALVRDPRAVTVSAYFHTIREHPTWEMEPLDQYFQKLLGPYCMWTTVRYLLFSELLADRSELFFFEDMMIDPVDWYGRFFPFAGLNLPVEVMFDIARVAGEGGRLFSGHRKGVDEHPGSIAQGHDRTFRDELGPDSLAMMDDVLRVWLPSVLLRRFGVSP